MLVISSFSTVDHFAAFESGPSTVLVRFQARPTARDRPRTWRNRVRNLVEALAALDRCRNLVIIGRDISVSIAELLPAPRLGVWGQMPADETLKNLDTMCLGRNCLDESTGQ